MGVIELWLGATGTGKTGRALEILRAELDRDWRAVRYLVPTVGHKRSIEQLLLQRSARSGLFGDPVNIFFTFAQEVAARGGVDGNHLSELQKHLLLKDLVRSTPLDYFARAARFPGFVLALREAIDELKVHMILSDDLLAASAKASERGATAFATKIHELGTLYGRYQQQLIEENLYDNEGIMWLAAERLRTQPELCGDLRCLVLDGFARLTPIQLHFLHALAPRVERSIVLFDYEEGRTASFHPVQASLDRLQVFAEAGQVQLHTVPFAMPAVGQNALACVRTEVFRDRRRTCAPDSSLQLNIAATPAHEADMMAREIRGLLRARKLPDGTPFGPGDIAILARNAEQLRERLASSFARFGLSVRRDPPLLAHTPIGRALLATFRLVRERWQREDVLTLLKSGFLRIAPGLACQVELIARAQYLRDRRASWTEAWPDEESREALAHAVYPLLAFDDAYHRRVGARGLMDALDDLIRAFRTQGLPTIPPLPEDDAPGAQRYIALHAAFQHLEQIMDDLRRLGPLLGSTPYDETLELVMTALLRESVPNPATPSEGIPVLPVHATGGEKFKMVLLCDLVQGTFPRHQRESAFLMDHEREGTLRDLQINIDTRKHLENDEQFWFLHALSSATHYLVLSYAQHDVDGRPRERSLFLDEVERVIPDLSSTARRTSFRDLLPPLSAAENAEEFLAGLAYGLRSERGAEGRTRLAAAYTASPLAHGAASALARLYGRAQDNPSALTGVLVGDVLARRQRAYSASELQCYCDCPFLWFASYCLGLREVEEEFSALDRGMILHHVLEQLYRRRQDTVGEPVHLEDEMPDALWAEVEVDLRAALAAEPRYQNRATFLRDIEWAALRRMLQRFLRDEIARARTRRVHPAYFERAFGYQGQELTLANGSVRLRGTVDRIDLSDDDLGQAVVVDYKSSARMSLRELASGKVLQAPVYLLALQRAFGLVPLGAEFMGLRQSEARGIYCETAGPVHGTSRGMKTLDRGGWESFLAESEARLCAAAADSRAGRIPRTPTTNRCPESCAYLSLCRGERFALARYVRTDDAAETGG
ncbi:MAG TPA: PD-(D/E)XK nuclease family protein [Armatimonadota bacterium]|jgi:ATP-dependent helicase/DNAse subunit B